MRRHAGMLLPLAWPSMLSRVGLVVLGTVDTIMVGQFSTQELAYLSLGNGTFFMIILMITISLLLGILVFTAEAYGREDYKACGRIFHRSLPVVAVLGLLTALICIPGETYFLLSGQTEELSRQGGRVMMILGFGLPGHVIFALAIFFMEGIARPKPVMYGMLAVNIANVGLNYVLIFGAFGLPALGAEGSAWATTILRWLLAGWVLLYLFKSPTFAKFDLWSGITTPWKEWRGQRHLGYASAVGMGAEVSAFAALNLFSGWLGVVHLAAFGIAFNLMTIPFMLALGIGSATAVRVGIARSRGDYLDRAIAGWTGIVAGMILLAFIGAAIVIFVRPVLALYTSDPVLVTVALPLFLLTGYVLIFDGGQAIVANALRGLGETWVPMGIQVFSYFGIMIPLSYFLAFPMAHGTVGLFEATIIASIVSVVLQGIRFQRKAIGG